MNRQEALDLLERFQTPMHVRAHCSKVARVAEFLARQLREVALNVDPELAWLGGMVHDFVRVVDFRTLDSALGTPYEQAFWQRLRADYAGRHHADVGADILETMGESALAKIVRVHKTRAILSHDSPQTWEEKLVYYADKRVSHDQIVSLRERLEEIRLRYFGGQPLTSGEKKYHDAIFALEKEIFSHLPITPEDVPL